MHNASDSTVSIRNIDEGNNPVAHGLLRVLAHRIFTSSSRARHSGSEKDDWGLAVSLLSFYWDDMQKSYATDGLSPEAYLRREISYEGDSQADTINKIADSVINLYGWLFYPRAAA